MINLLRIAGRSLPVATGKLLYFRPIRQQPCLEIMLRGMRMKSWFVTYPLSHLRLGIRCIQKFARMRPRIDIGKGNHMIAGVFSS